MSFVQSLFATPYGAFAALILIMVLGEIITKLTKGFVPLAFSVTVLLFAAFWSGIYPATVGESGQKLYEVAGIGSPIFSLCSCLLVVNLGTLINKKEMIAQWKTVLISLAGLAAICLITLTVGSAIYGKNDALAATPVLAGAAMAVTIVKAATASFDMHLYLVAVVVMAVQGIFGYPLVSFCLRKEAKRLVTDYRSGLLKAPVVDSTAAAKAGAKKDSMNMILLKMAVIGVLSYIVEYLTDKAGFKISLYVWAMVFGFIAHELGIIGDDALTGAGCYGFCMTVLMLYLFGSLAGYSAAVVLPTFAEAAVFILLASAGMALVAFILAKVFKKSFWICWAITLNAYLGFPVNVMITNEAVENTTEPGEERAIVSAELMPQMLVASFVSVTIVSVIIAGFIVTRFVV